MRKLYLFIMVSAFAAALMCSCIKNDMSYPIVEAYVDEFEVEGQKSVEIDKSSRTISLVLEETADMSSLKVVKFSMKPEEYYHRPLCSTAEFSVGDNIDLTSELTFSLKTFQEYEWKITATQPIERYVNVENAVDVEFYLREHKVLVSVSPNQSLSEIVIEDMKLGPEGSTVTKTIGTESGETITRDCIFPMTLDCLFERTFYVVYNGESEKWTVSFVQKSVELAITYVNAWALDAMVEGEFDGNGTPYVEYRKESESKWKKSTDVIVSKSSVTANIKGLSHKTAYVARLVNGEQVSDEYSFTTEEAAQLANMSYDDWYTGNPNSTWYPGPSGKKIWDTANKGTNMFSSQNPSRPEEGFIAVKGQGKKAARLETISFLGKLAAGNVITGEFLRASVSGGVGAELTWGTPFASRPKALKGYYAYDPKVIDTYYDEELHADKKGTMDKLQILVMLTDWDEPFLVKTASKVFVDQENDPHIIAHGTIESDVKTVDENGNLKYVEFECKLNYRDTKRKPKYVVVISCSSLYGDYFTGGEHSVLYVDEYSFVY